MKRKMKSISLLCAVAMLGGVLAGCGNANANQGSVQASEETGTAAETDNEQNASMADFDGPMVDPATPTVENYNLIWSDEFEGDSLNATIWNREKREPGWTNAELQEYTDSNDNIYVKDGSLHLKAIKTQDENGNDYYTSGKVNSQNKADFQYGKVVARAKVPEGQGLWPAIWMMPKEEGVYGQWPKCGEIDIMEVLGNDTTTAYSTLHYGEPHGQQQGTLVLDGDKYSDGFHTYSVEWEPGEIRWYIDYTPVLVANDWFTAEGELEQPYPAPFNQPFFVQMNLAVGGTWPGNPDETTVFDDNTEFVIDYVRVYQRDEYDMNVSKPVYDIREPDENGNYVTDWDFSDDSEDLADEVDWEFLIAQNGEGEAAIKDNMIEITSSAAGDVDYSVQLVHWAIPFFKDHKYRVTFDAKASEDRTIITAVTAPYVDWIRYYPDTYLDVTTDWNTYTYEFDMTEKDDIRGRLEFNLGNQNSTATVDITNVKVEDITE